MEWQGNCPQSCVSRIYSEGVFEQETKREQSFPYESGLSLVPRAKYKE